MEEILTKILSSLKSGQPCATATIVESTAQGTPCKIGAKMVVLSGGSSFGTVGGGQNEEHVKKACLKALKSQKSSLIQLAYTKKDQFLCGGQIKVFIEPFVAQKNLIICGGGHIGLPLSILGKVLGFKVTLLDSRKDFANKKRFGHVDKIICGNIAANLSKLTIDPQTRIVVIGHNHEIDFDCLKTVIKSKSGYIGIIASQAKKKEFIQRLKSLNIPKNLINFVNMPIGIDIGARTPSEIAVSIMAEIIAQDNKEFVGSFKFDKKSK